MLEGLAPVFLLAQLGLSGGDTNHMQNCYSGINLNNLEFSQPYSQVLVRHGLTRL
jgi:hypothetical protein